MHVFSKQKLLWLIFTVNHLESPFQPVRCTKLAAKARLAAEGIKSTGMPNQEATWEMLEV